MSSPLGFLIQFRRQLRNADIRFALTSGQACVHFGIQQTTKDSDWIVEPHDLMKLCLLLQENDSTSKCRVSFRPICGAPILKEFLGNGWTSHIEITDSEGELHRLDFFGKPPRVSLVEYDPQDSDYASRFVVAQMKKTDREKDWPFVFGLGRQAIAEGDVRGVLHGMDAEWLINVWAGIAEDERPALIRQRPLLNFVDSQPDRVRRAIMIEKQIWQSVNCYRYDAFQSAWKEFYRQWRREPNFEWPRKISFADQCACLNNAAQKYGLPQAPLDDARRRKALTKARQDAAEIFAAADEELDLITPPLEVMLP